MSQKTSSIKEFLGGQVCLIVEPSSAFSSSIHACLMEFGLTLSQILTVRKFEDAKRIIHEKKPKVVISEYEVGTDLGLSLLELQGEYYPDEMSRISIIVTRNSADSAIAEAAEEQVDAYILKPFSVDFFRDKITTVFNRKMNPSNYMEKIRAGKNHFSLNEFKESVADFGEAKKLDDKPTLACFYSGQSYQAMGDKVKALAEFKEGRKYQPLHYKCLIGEFESEMAEQKYAEAYVLVELIRTHYPITSHRLGQFFIAAVFTYHFDELPTLYQIYLKLEQRPAKLVQLTSMALFTAGRYWVNQNSLQKAVDCFEMGVMASGREIGYIEKVINIFLKIKAAKESQVFFSKIQPSDVGTSAYNRLGFKIDQFILSKNQLIEKGRKIVAADEATPEIYISLVGLLADENKISMAESIISKALATYPEMRAELYQILKEKEGSS
jgi:tetratricopeptide (TPR) repeat protein